MTGSRTRPAGPAAYLAAVSVLAATLVAARMFTSGAAWHWDSVRYLAAARSLLAGSGFVDVGAQPGYSYWPPLYPLLLAAGGLFTDPVEVPGPLNAAAFALTIFCFGRYLWARLDSPFLRVWAPLACALSLPLAENARWAMTETIFILLVTLALIGIDEYRANGSPKALVFAAVFSALAWQTRYAGAALVVTMGLLVLSDRRRPFRERVRRSAILGAITGAPMALWLLRNYRLRGKPITTVRPETAHDWREILDGTVGHLASWTDFDTGPTTLAIVSFLTLAAVLARKRLKTTGRQQPTSAARGQGPGAAHRREAPTGEGCGEGCGEGVAPSPRRMAGAVAQRFAPPARGKSAPLGNRTGTSRTPVAERRAGCFFHGPLSRPNWLAVWGLFSLAYLVLVVVALRTGSTWHGVQARHLTPLYVPTVAVVAGLCDRFLARARTRRTAAAARGAGGLFRGAGGSLPRLAGPAATIVVMIVLSWWSVGQAGLAADAIARENSSDFTGTGYASPRWADSETLGALRPSAAALYTNSRSAVSLYTGAHGMPPMPANRDLAVETVLTKWLDRVPDGSRIIWFRRWEENRERFAPTPLALRGSPSLVPVGEFSDGTIFEVDRTSSPAMPSPPTIHFDSVVADSPDALRVRDVFDLYIEGGNLWYFRQPCVAGDVEERFQLTVTVPTPTAPDGLRRKHLDFDFADYGVLSKGRCLAVVPLRADGHSKFETGQPQGTTPWRASGLLDPERHRTALRSIASGEWRAPIAESEFEVHLRGRELRYYREPCTPADVAERFFLGLHRPPLDAAPAREPLDRGFDFSDYGIVEDGRCLALVPLPEGRYTKLDTGQWAGPNPWRAEGRLDRDRYRAALASWAEGEWGEPDVRAAFDLYDREGEVRYVRKPCAAEDTAARFYLHFHEAGAPAVENRDFDFTEYGVVLDDACLAIVPQPEGDFRRIATGQFTGGNRIWRAELRPEKRRRESLLESIAAGRRGPPAARSTFDLHFVDSALVFHRAPCSAGDVEARFFLHLYAEDAADLPAERRDDGFENRDFDFGDYGDSFAEACIARVPLPDYPISRIRTGQFRPGGGTRWSAEPRLRPTGPSR